VRILFLGDVVGKAGRDAVAQYLPVLQNDYSPNFIIVNGENTAHGFGILPQHCEDFFAQGVDVITLGNHSFDKPQIVDYIAKEKKLLRPCNYITEHGEPFGIYSKNNFKIMVVNLLGKVFMHSKISYSDPFLAMEAILKDYTLQDNVDAIFVDFHAETSSEKMAMGHFLDGKVTAVIGTHSHIPTADSRILVKGTGYQTDVGMCGDYNSIIGMSYATSMNKFVNNEDGMKKKAFEPSNGAGDVACVVVDIDTSTGLCYSVLRMVLGNVFKQGNKNDANI
jgi:metallophosphoesterase (TIGR00282 family)